MNDEPKVEEKAGSWKQDNFSGYNERFLELFEKINQLSKVTLNAKLIELKGNVRREARKHNHPLLNSIADEVEKLEIRG